MKTHHYRLLTFINFLFLHTLFYAAPSPSTMFDDHMVLQQEMPVPIWGTAKKGEKITVSFDGQKKTTITNSDGKWMVTLKPLKASFKGKTLKISGDTDVSFSDVVVGEVWICSGQSNMAFPRNLVEELTPLYEKVKNKSSLRTLKIIETASLTPMDNAVAKWSTLPSESAVAFSFSYHLQKEINVPVGIIATNWGGTQIESWMPKELTKELPHFKEKMEAFQINDKKKIEAYIKKTEKYPNRGKGLERKQEVYLRSNPNILYNAMIHPLIPFAFRGMVWYQGEGNSKTSLEHERYKKSLPIWVKKLRENWNRDFCFMAVMLPGFGRGMKNVEYPNVFCWASFREAQENLLTEPNTFISNSIDLGSINNLHPSDKEPIGQRLSLLARKHIYAQDIEAQGPCYQKHTIKDDKLIIHFDHAKGLKTKDGSSPKGFWLSGENEQWYMADAKIDGTTVILNSKEVKNPKACRYAFAAKPTVNLVNSAGLPAYPFRTDDRPLPKK